MAVRLDPLALAATSTSSPATIEPPLSTSMLAPASEMSTDEGSPLRSRPILGSVVVVLDRDVHRRRAVRGVDNPLELQLGVVLRVTGAVRVFSVSGAQAHDCHAEGLMWTFDSSSTGARVPCSTATATAWVRAIDGVIARAGVEHIVTTSARHQGVRARIRR